MKFSTSKKELQEALQKLSKATPTRTTLPILNCVLIKATNEKTSLRTTDLELTIDLEISVSIEEEGSAAVPLKQLYDITSELPETRITIIVDNKNKTKIKTNSGSYDLMGKQKEEFPATPKIDETKKINIPGKTLRNIIDSTLFAVSKDDLKPSLTGVLFSFNKNNKRFCLEKTAPGINQGDIKKLTGFKYDLNTSIKNFILPSKSRLKILRKIIAPMVSEFYPHFAKKIWSN